MRQFLLLRFLFLVGACLGLSGSLEVAAQHFAAIGDYGSASEPERDVAELVKSWKPEFIITLGDNNYERGEASTIDANIGQYYHDFISPYLGKYGAGAPENRFFPSIGNHDGYTRSAKPYLDYFSLPGNERYYDYVRGQVHFFVLNSDATERDGTLANSVQASWLKARMAASTSVWKVVYFHNPPYSSGYHGNNLTLRWPFAEWGASLVLSGHDHHYERLVVGGLTYCVNGLGGRSKYGLTAPQEGSLVRYNEEYGAQLFDASADSLRLRFYTRSGKLVDSYTLRREQGTEPQLLAIYPTPIRETTQVAFFLPTAEDVSLRLLDALGREVAIMHKGPLRAGRHELLWSRGSVPAGAYFVQLVSGRHRPVLRTVAL